MSYMDMTATDIRRDSTEQKRDAWIEYSASLKVKAMKTAILAGNSGPAKAISEDLADLLCSTITTGATLIKTALNGDDAATGAMVRALINRLIGDASDSMAAKEADEADAVARPQLAVSKQNNRSGK